MKRVRSHVTAQVSAIHQQVQGALNKNNNSSSNSSQGANAQGNSGMNMFLLLYSLYFN